MPEQYKLDSYYSDIVEEKGEDIQSEMGIVEEDFKDDDHILNNFYKEVFENSPENNEYIFDIKNLCKKEFNNYIKVNCKTIIKIADDSCSASVSSNCKTLEINKTMRKTMFTKKSTFYVIFSDKDKTSGYLRVSYKGKTSFLPFFMDEGSAYEIPQSGIDISESFDIKKWYLKDIFLPDKNLDVFYHEITSINFSFDAISKIILNSLSVGVNVIFRYNILYREPEMLLDSEKMDKYLEVFKNFTEFIGNYPSCNKVIFEPLLIFDYHERPPKKIFCNVTGKNIVSFSRIVNDICVKNNVDISYSVDFNKIISQVNLKEYVDPTSILYHLDEISSRVNVFMNYFITPLQKNIAIDFIYPENENYDSYQCLLFFCRSLTNKLTVYGNSVKCTLFLSGGHLNNSKLVSKYTNSIFENCKKEILSTVFIFGKDFINFGKNIFIQKNKDGVFSDLIQKYNIEKILFKLSPEDHNYTIQRINEEKTFS